jgi:hypothetical protein
LIIIEKVGIEFGLSVKDALILIFQNGTVKPELRLRLSQIDGPIRWASVMKFDSNSRFAGIVPSVALA